MLHHKKKVKVYLGLPAMAALAAAWLARLLGCMGVVTSHKHNGESNVWSVSSPIDFFALCCGPLIAVQPWAVQEGPSNPDPYMGMR